MMTLRQKYEAMSDGELRERREELTKILNYGGELSWDEAYKEYMLISSIEDERYYNENINKFDAWYEKNIKGKTIDEIDDDTLQFYSDWHKDMYGYRPRCL